MIIVRRRGLRAVIEGLAREDKALQVLVGRREQIYREFVRGAPPQVLRTAVDEPLFYAGNNRVETGIGGLLFLLPKLKDRPIQLEGFDWQPLPQPDTGLYPHLRQYQMEALQRMCESQCGIIILPTGAGKTEIFLAFLDWYLRCQGANNLKPGRALIIVPKNSIRDEIIDRGRRYNLHVTEFRGGGTIEVTFPKRVKNAVERGELEDLEYEVVIVDECHHSAASMWITTLLGLPSIRQAFGFTATLPGNIAAPTAKGVGDIRSAWALVLLGPVIYRKRFKDIRSMDPVFQSTPPPILLNLDYTATRVPSTTNDYRIIKKFLLSEARLKFVSRAAAILAQFGSVIILVSEIEPGQRLLELLKTASTPGLLWHGKSIHTNYPKERLVNALGDEATWQSVKPLVERQGLRTREEVLDLLLSQVEGRRSHLYLLCKLHFYAGLCRVIIATQVGREGVDLPAMDSTILLEGTGDIPILQSVGRILRPKDKPPLIVNIWDRAGIPAAASKRRQKLLVEEIVEPDHVLHVRSLEEFRLAVARLRS